MTSLASKLAASQYLSAGVLRTQYTLLMASAEDEHGMSMEEVPLDVRKKVVVKLSPAAHTKKRISLSHGRRF
jgi:hypothetical protein